jgi:hypothetical protein
MSIQWKENANGNWTHTGAFGLVTVFWSRYKDCWSYVHEGEYVNDFASATEAKEAVEEYLYG